MAQQNSQWKILRNTDQNEQLDTSTPLNKHDVLDAYQDAQRHLKTVEDLVNWLSSLDTEFSAQRFFSDKDKDPELFYTTAGFLDQSGDLLTTFARDGYSIGIIHPKNSELLAVLMPAFMTENLEINPFSSMPGRTSFRVDRLGENVHKAESKHVFSTNATIDVTDAKGDLHARLVSVDIYKKLKENPDYSNKLDIIPKQSNQFNLATKETQSSPDQLNVTQPPSSDQKDETPDDPKVANGLAFVFDDLRARHYRLFNTLKEHQKTNSFTYGMIASKKTNDVYAFTVSQPHVHKLLNFIEKRLDLDVERMDSAYIGTLNAKKFKEWPDNKIFIYKMNQDDFGAWVPKAQQDVFESFVMQYFNAKLGSASFIDLRQPKADPSQVIDARSSESGIFEHHEIEQPAEMVVPSQSHEQNVVQNTIQAQSSSNQDNILKSPDILTSSLLNFYGQYGRLNKAASEKNTYANIEHGHENKVLYKLLPKNHAQDFEKFLKDAVGDDAFDEKNVRVSSSNFAKLVGNSLTNFLQEDKAILTVTSHEKSSFVLVSAEHYGEYVEAYAKDHMDLSFDASANQKNEDNAILDKKKPSIALSFGMTDAGVPRKMLRPTQISRTEFKSHYRASINEAIDKGTYVLVKNENNRDDDLVVFPIEILDGLQDYMKENNISLEIRNMTGNEFKHNPVEDVRAALRDNNTAIVLVNREKPFAYVTPHNGVGETMRDFLRDKLVKINPDARTNFNTNAKDTSETVETDVQAVVEPEPLKARSEPTVTGLTAEKVEKTGDDLAQNSKEDLREVRIAKIKKLAMTISDLFDDGTVHAQIGKSNMFLTNDHAFMTDDAPKHKMLVDNLSTNPRTQANLAQFFKFAKDGEQVRLELSEENQTYTLISEERIREITGQKDLEDVADNLDYLDSLDF